ncbi:MAG TPA: serine hydrolase [Armatimonadota bacterium]|nr:serine hydrolase [Armatimonadota bacterium]
MRQFDSTPNRPYGGQPPAVRARRRRRIGRAALMASVGVLLAAGAARVFGPGSGETAAAPAQSGPHRARATGDPVLADGITGLAQGAERAGVARRVGVSVVAAGRADAPLGGYRAGDNFPAASVIKVPVMLALEARWQEGSLPRTAAHRRLLERMIQVSDNAATNALIDVVGLPRVNQEIRQVLGVERLITVLGRKLSPTASGPPRNRGCAREIARLLAWIATEEKAGDARAVDMLRIMRGTSPDHRTRIPAAIPLRYRRKVANKTGTLARVVNDAAIVETPSGERYVLCILMDGVGAGRRGEAERFCREVSALCWRRLSGKGLTPGRG